ncbi:MAG: hypothetical protein AB4290_09055 [Spirulina sp.]
MISDSLNGNIGNSLRERCRLYGSFLIAVAKMQKIGALTVNFESVDARVIDGENGVLRENEDAIILAFSGTQSECLAVKEIFDTVLSKRKAFESASRLESHLWDVMARSRLINQSLTVKALKKAASALLSDAGFDSERVEEFLQDRYLVRSLEELTIQQLEDLINQF